MITDLNVTEIVDNVIERINDVDENIESGITLDGNNQVEKITFNDITNCSAEEYINNRSDVYNRLVYISEKLKEDENIYNYITEYDIIGMRLKLNSENKNSVQLVPTSIPSSALFVKYNSLPDIYLIDRSSILNNGKCTSYIKSLNKQNFIETNYSVDISDKITNINREYIQNLPSTNAIGTYNKLMNSRPDFSTYTYSKIHLYRSTITLLNNPWTKFHMEYILIYSFLNYPDGNNPFKINGLFPHRIPLSCKLYNISDYILPTELYIKDCDVWDVYRSSFALVDITKQKLDQFIEYCGLSVKSKTDNLVCNINRYNPMCIDNTISVNFTKKERTLSSFDEIVCNRVLMYMLYKYYFQFIQENYPDNNIEDKINQTIENNDK